MLLLERTRTGLREMPSNAAWLVSRALRPADAIGSAAESAGAGARDRGRKVKAAVVDAAPIGGGLGRSPDEACARRRGACAGGRG